MKATPIQKGIVKKILKKEVSGPLTLQINSIRNKDGSTLLEFTDNEDTIKGVQQGIANFEAKDIVTITKYTLHDIGPQTAITVAEMAKHKPDPKTTPSELQRVEDSPPNDIPMELLDKNEPLSKMSKSHGFIEPIRMENTNYIPISHLSSTLNSFVIKGRVVEKHEARTYRNSKGDGKILRFEVADTESSIEIVCFNEAVDKFNNIIEKDHIYLFKNGLIKISNKKYTSIKNDLSITLDKNSEIIPCSEDKDFKFMSYNFTTLKELIEVDIGHFDIIGIIISEGPCNEIITKKGEKILKKSVYFTDESKIKAQGVLWKENTKESFEPNSIVAFKGCDLKRFQGVLNFNINSNSIIRNPNHPRVEQLKKYLAANSSNLVDTSSVTKSEAMPTVRAHIQDLRNKFENSNIEDPNIAYSVVADINLISAKKLFYLGCPTCKKRVNDEASSFKCEKCNKSITAPNVVLMSSLKILDQTGSIFVSIFGDKAEKLFKVTGEEIKSYKDNKEDNKIKLKFDAVKFQTYEFIIKAKPAQIGQNEKVSYSVIFINEVNQESESLKMIKDLKAMQQSLKI
jgi:replication factor A1